MTHSHISWRIYVCVYLARLPSPCVVMGGEEWVVMGGCVCVCLSRSFTRAMWVARQLPLLLLKSHVVWHIRDMMQYHGWCSDMSHELCMWVTNYVCESRSGHRRIQMPVRHYGWCADMSLELCICAPTAAAVAQESRCMMHTWHDAFTHGMTHSCVHRSRSYSRHEGRANRCCRCPTATHDMTNAYVSFRKRASLSATEPLMIGLFCATWPIKIRYSMHLCHPVSNCHIWHDQCIRDMLHSCVPRTRSYSRHVGCANCRSRFSTAVAHPPSIPLPPRGAFSTLRTWCHTRRCSRSASWCVAVCCRVLPHFFLLARCSRRDIYTYMYIWTYIYMNIYVYMYICIYIYMNIYMYEYIWADMYICIYVYMYILGVPPSTPVWESGCKDVCERETQTQTQPPTHSHIHGGILGVPAGILAWESEGVNMSVRERERERERRNDAHTDTLSLTHTRLPRSSCQCCQRWTW